MPLSLVGTPIQSGEIFSHDSCVYNDSTVAQETPEEEGGADGEIALPVLSVVNTMLMRKTEVGWTCVCGAI